MAVLPTPLLLPAMVLGRAFPLQFTLAYLAVLFLTARTAFIPVRLLNPGPDDARR